MVYQWISNALAPALALCLLCRGSCAHPSGICAECRDELPYLGRACRHCALPLPSAADSCANCLQQAPAFDSACAAWHYAFPIGQLIQRFKYRGDLAAGHSLATLAALRLQPRDAIPDLLLPIPLHWRRYWRRGFNQAQLVAAEFSRQWRIPLATRLLRKRTASEAQQQLRRAQRLRNLGGSFYTVGSVAGLHIGLVDDVITTGATLETAARELRAAGATAISAFALARTP